MKKLLPAFLLCAAAVQASAQTTFSAIPETLIGSFSGAGKTANDKKASMNVVVWDGPNAGLFYYQEGLSPISGTVPLPSGIADPDVIVSSNMSGGPIWALVVYRLAGNFVLDRYQWSGSTFTFINTNSFPDIPGGFTPSIRIDGDVIGDYAIAVNFSNGSLRVLHGTNATLPGGLLNNGVLPAGTGGSVDVALDYNSQSTYGPVGATNIHLVYGMNDGSTFYGEAYNHIVTRFVPFSSTAFSSVTMVSPATGELYGWGRIAAPYYNGMTNDRFSIIYTQFNTAYYVFQYNNYGTGTNNLSLTGGGSGYPSPAVAGNKRPAITFAGKQQPITISAWETVYTGSVSIAGEKVVPTGGLSGPVTYYIMNTPAVPGAVYVALSSKYAFSENVLASYTDGGSNVYYKLFDNGAPTMRLANPNAAANIASAKNITISPNPASDHIRLHAENVAADAVLKVYVTDIMGRVSCNCSGTLQDLQTTANTWFAGVVPGVYYMTVSTEDGYSQALKLVKE